jgi:pimeloyl-ACP methyl ester carboxylesterase
MNKSHPSMARQLAGLAGVALAAFHCISPATVAAAEPPARKERAVQTVTSRDGTRIAFDQTGTGRALLIVNGALADRAAGAELAKLLAPHFTVYSYDRRGRGSSGDTQPYAVQREIEDIEALIDRAGGSALVYGKSSGAALALQAASSLGGKVSKLALYEAPYDDADGAAKEWREFRARHAAALAAGRNDEAVAMFLQFVGMPAQALQQLKASPAWAGMVAMAPSLAYDNAVLGEDRSVPTAVAAKVKAPTLVMDGSASLKSMPFMRATADKLGKTIPHAQRQVLEGEAHDASAKAMAPVLVKFFGGA